MPRNLDEDYIDLVECAVNFGESVPSRVGNTRRLFSRTLEIESLLYGQFPILTTRKIFYEPVLGELAAFLRGATMVREFKEFGCNYWDANAAAWAGNIGLPPEQHRVGNIYGAKWRNFHGVDQIARLVIGIKNDPYSRRHLLTAYDPSEPWQCLAPCHLLAQFAVVESRLELAVYMRSVDLCLGLPSDIILYATLLLLVCKETHHAPGRITFHLGDTHIYENHVDTFLNEQLYATQYEPPTYKLNPGTSLDTFKPLDLLLFNYDHGAKLVYPLAT